MDYELGFVKIENGRYEVIDKYLEADEIFLDADEYYAIFVEEDIYDKSDIEIDYSYLGNITSEQNVEFYVFAFESYHNYQYEVDALTKDIIEDDY